MKNLSKDSIILACIISGFIAISSLIFICGSDIVVHGILRDVDQTTTGPKGDTFGGTIGPFIAWLATLATFAAFWVQYIANVQQKRDLQLERFENKYYELIRLHNDNVSQIKIKKQTDNIEKRKAFEYLYEELKYIYLLCTNINHALKAQFAGAYELHSDNKLIKLSYMLFYVGVGRQSDIVSNYLKDDSIDKRLFDAVLKRLKGLQDDSLFVTFYDSNKNPFRNRDLHTDRFSGHMNNLGIYYRHLFQIVKYVANQEESLLAYNAKREYLRTLRAQLSDFEQLMLYYNASSGFGHQWIDNNYFTLYKMIHNMPLPLADFGINPLQLFKEELNIENVTDPIFEWYRPK